jgi:heptosyltransferase-2
MNKHNPDNWPDLAQNNRLSGATDLVSNERVRRARVGLAAANKIAVLTKFRFMGDTVVATPFLRQLRGHYPDAAIDLLAAPCVVDALANCPYLDRIIPVDISGVSRWQHGKDLHDLLKQGGYSVAFVLNRSLHCAVTAALSRIPVRIGYANELRRFLLTVPIPYVFDRNEVDCHLDMLRSIGLSTEHALPDLWITETELEAARESLAARGWKRGAPVIGVQPGANDPYIREWGAERYASTAGKLADEMGASVVLMGGKAERETSERMAAAMKHPPINLVGELSLRDALCTIGLCSLWLGNDTGLLHCAVAQRVASVGIFGPNKAVRWGYDSPRHRSLVSFPQTPAKDDDAVRRCLDAISEDEVLETARAVLDAPNLETVDTASPLAVATGTILRAPYFAATLSPEGAGPVRRR